VKTSQKSQYSCISDTSATGSPYAHYYDWNSYLNSGYTYKYCKLNFLNNGANDDNGFSSSSSFDDGNNSSPTSDSSISSGAIIGIIIGIVAVFRILLGLLSWYKKKRGYKSSIENKPLGHLISCCCGIPPCFNQGGMTACLKDFKTDLESNSVLSFFKDGINITSLFKISSIISYFKGGETEETEVRGETEEKEGVCCSCFSSKKEEIEMPSSISKETKESYIPSISISSSVWYHPSPPPRGTKSNMFLDVSTIKLNNR